MPSFRNRPLTEKEYALGKKLNSAEEQGNSKFRILVVGGGEPQYRHLDKFKEYAKILGFKGTWRLAEYTSWHKEMDRLGRDMASRYDALVILHWNRTTFGRQARAICNQKGQKPCINIAGVLNISVTAVVINRQLSKMPCGVPPLHP